MKTLILATALPLFVACAPPAAPQPHGTWVPVNRQLIRAASEHASATEQVNRPATARSLDGSSSEPKAGRHAPFCDATSKDESSGAAEAGLDQLRNTFGAVAVRDRANEGLIQLRLRGDIERAPSIETMDGETVPTIWDTQSKILTFKWGTRFVVTDGVTGLEVNRLSTYGYNVEGESSGRLEMVFDRDGATYFRFAEGVQHVSVLDGQGQGNGERKGRYYRFAGVTERYQVQVDGHAIQVSRVPQVQFYVRRLCLRNHEGKTS